MRRFWLIDLLLWSVTKGGYGALAGAVGGTAVALGAFFGPSFLENGLLCESERACDDTLGWIIIIAIIAAGMGMILGGLFGIGGEIISSKVFGPDKQKVGTVIGGLIGGVTPWAILLILNLTSSE